MDRFKQIETFVAVAQKGSLSAAAKAEGVAPAIIGRRIDALEARLGVKLLIRTTRKVSLTYEGSGFFEECQQVLRDLADAESGVSLGGVKPSGHLRLTAPAGFGRRHVAPLLPGFLERHPEVSVSLDLTDRVVDLISEGFDCAVRIGELPDSSLVGLRLAENRRVVVASPAYLNRAGLPERPEDLARHACLSFGHSGPQSRGWQFRRPDGSTFTQRVSGPLECSDGAVLHAWTLAGCGLAWRSLWEVQADIDAGRLCTVLDEFAAPPTGIFAVYPQRKHLPLRVRAFVEHLRQTYGHPQYWRSQSGG
jgi:DNA-binding transcriptional LysR family regulator